MAPLLISKLLSDHSLRHIFRKKGRVTIDANLHFICSPYHGNERSVNETIFALKHNDYAGIRSQFDRKIWWNRTAKKAFQEAMDNAPIERELCVNELVSKDVYYLYYCTILVQNTVEGTRLRPVFARPDCPYIEPLYNKCNPLATPPPPCCSRVNSSEKSIAHTHTTGKIISTLLKFALAVVILVSVPKLNMDFESQFLLFFICACLQVAAIKMVLLVVLVNVVRLILTLLVVGLVSYTIQCSNP